MNGMTNEETLGAILDAYVYEVVFADRGHIVRYMNAAAKRKYGAVIGYFERHEAI